SDLSAVASHLASLASQTAGVVVDVSQDDQVAAANLQADANPACAFAKNLVGLEIKRIIDSYRALNPLKHIVLVGNDGLIPCFRRAVLPRLPAVPGPRTSCGPSSSVVATTWSSSGPTSAPSAPRLRTFLPAYLPRKSPTPPSIGRTSSSSVRAATPDTTRWTA